MRLHDVTLREGEQRSGQSYSVDQKVRGAEILDELGVDYIQIGFPVAEDGTKETCERLDTDAEIVGLARAIENDLDAAIDAGVEVIDLGIPTSDLQREQILGIDQSAVLKRAGDLYEYAHDRGVDVHLSAMDSFRADPSFLNDLIDTVDPSFFTLLDTVGVATPPDVTTVIQSLDCDPDSIGVHFHKDLGVATANVLTAARHGVGKADVTVGGIGERVGNAALEEVVVAGTVGGISVEFDIDLDQLVPQCQSLLETLEEQIPPNKPVLGDLAFEHESGMHTAAMLDEPSVFEAFDPTRFGGKRRLLFGHSTGQGAARRLLERAGAVNPSQKAIEEFESRLHNLEKHVELNQALMMARKCIEHQ